jgi:hypothetical protein
MVKLLITIAVIYFAYRFFIAPPAISNRGPGPKKPVRRSRLVKKRASGEYVDYEEVD